MVQQTNYGNTLTKIGVVCSVFSLSLLTSLYIKKVSMNIDTINIVTQNVELDLKIILDHYNATFDDVVVENIFTTDISKFLEVASYRNTIYTNQFPTGSWLGVKELALPEFIIEIELEVHMN